MKMITNKINNRIDACFFYIDEIDKDLKEIIKKCFLGQNYDLRIEKVFRKIGSKFFYELEQDFL